MIKDTRKRFPGRIKEEPAPEGESGRVTRGVRISRSLNNWLVAEAKLRGHSFNQELEYRLDIARDVMSLVKATLVHAYGDDVAREMFEFAGAASTMRVVAEMKAKGTLNDEAGKIFIAASVKSLTDMIERLRNRVEGN